MPPRALSLVLLVLTLVCGITASSAQLSHDEAIRNSLRAPEPSPAAVPVALDVETPVDLTLAPSVPVAAVSTLRPAMSTAAPSVVADALTPSPTTYKNVTSDMKLVIKEVGQVACPEEVRKNSFAIYKNNRVMFDTCSRESKYQLLPHEEGVPTPEQTTALVTSRACVDLFSGIILAEFPECDINNFSVRSAAEALFRIRKDVLAGRGAPSQRQFDEFYNLNRVINLLAENATLIESVFAQHVSRISLSEMTRMMNRIDIDPGVSITEDMTITVANRDKTGLYATADTSAAMTNSNGSPMILPSANASTATTSAASQQARTSHSVGRMLIVMMISILIVWS